VVARQCQGELGARAQLPRRHSSNRATAAALNPAVYRLRVFFVMTFLRWCSNLPAGPVWRGKVTLPEADRNDPFAVLLILNTDF
jgi:hypothetical protein